MIHNHIVTKEELLKDEVLLSLLPKNESNNYYLGYATLDDVYTVKYLPIDQFIDYIDKLNNEDTQYYRTSPQKRDAAIFEAIWLFDELACVKVNPFFAADITFGYSALSLYFNNGYEQESLLSLFDNNPVRRNIFFAQFFYFVKKYLKNKINQWSQIITMHDFEKRTLSILKKILYVRI